MSKVRKGIQHSYTQLYVDEIRLELYSLIRAIRMKQNSHKSAWMRDHGAGTHPADCLACCEFDNQVYGLRVAIKHFGGNPHYGW